MLGNEHLNETSARQVNNIRYDLPPQEDHLGGNKDPPLGIELVLRRFPISKDTGVVVCQAPVTGLVTVAL